MIVYMSLVVAAAVAAAVLIRTAGNLERKVQDAGRGATEEVSGNIYVRDIVGNVSSPDGDDVVTDVWWYISGAPGAQPLDLEAVTIRWTHDPNSTDLNHQSGACDDGLKDGFCLESVYDAGDGEVSILDEGDRVRVEVNLSASAGEELGTRETVDAVFTMGSGAPLEAGFETPGTFGGQSAVNLLHSS